MDWRPIFDGDSQVDKNLTFGSLGDDGGRGNFDSCFLGDLGGSLGVVGKACPEMCMTSSNVTGSLENARYSCMHILYRIEGNIIIGGIKFCSPTLIPTCIITLHIQCTRKKFNIKILIIIIIMVVAMADCQTKSVNTSQCTCTRDILTQVSNTIITLTARFTGVESCFSLLSPESAVSSVSPRKFISVSMRFAIEYSLSVGTDS